MSVTLRDFVCWLDQAIPLEYQEPYDNSGLQVGEQDSVIDSVLLTLDVTQEVIAEAVQKKCNLIVSHHPLIFTPLKRISEGSASERTVADAIRGKIAVYSSHTCFDAMSWGVSRIMAEKTGLNDIKILVPVSGKLFKIAVFVPVSHAEAVKTALFNAGAGHAGNYSSCGFASSGQGTFMAGEGATPYVGEVNKLFSGEEIKIETVVPSHLVKNVVRAMKKAHPYEEVAYDVYRLENNFELAGSGAIGALPNPLSGYELLENLKRVFNTPVIKYSGDPGSKIEKVAVCGGSGAGFINQAFHSGADAFITGDIKYHSFTEAPASMLIADIGHYESEKYSLKVLHDLIIKKFPKFALRFSETKTNPINYF
jgi:dinuclear metal center YbgI/SA1388 family protein